MSALVVAALIIMAAVSAWGFTLARASAHHSRLRAEMARAQEEMRREIRHWQEEAARARSHAAQVAMKLSPRPKPVSTIVNMRVPAQR